MLILIGGFVFGLVVGSVAWRVMRPEEPNTEANLKNFITFLGAIGGAAVLFLFPAGTDLFATYAIGLGVGFFLNPILHFFSQVRFSILRQQARKKAQEKAETQNEFLFAAQYINNHYSQILLTVAQKFRDDPSRKITVLDFYEFPIGIMTKLQIMRYFATTWPEIFSFDHHSNGGWGIQMRKEAITQGNYFLEDPTKETGLKSLLEKLEQESDSISHKPLVSG